MKIDLHCHTKAIKDGENSERNLYPEDYSMFFNNAKKNNLKIIAITNHNFFDLEQFNDIESNKYNDLLLLPGVELDLSVPASNPKDVLNTDSIKERNNKINDIFNLNIISDRDSKEEFRNMINEILNGDNPNDFLGIKIDELFAIVEKYDFPKIFLLPSRSKSNNKKKILAEEYINKLKKMASLKNNYYKYELGASSFKYNNKTQKVYKLNKLPYTIGSDSHSVLNIDYKYVESYDFDIEFSNIVEYIEFSKKVVETVVPAKSFELELDLINDDNVYIDKLFINFVKGINIITGKYGTGKSVLLNSALLAYNEMNNSDIKSFKGGQPQKNFDDIVSGVIENFDRQFIDEEIEIYEIKKYIVDSTLNKKLFSASSIKEDFIKITEYYRNEKNQTYNGWNNLSFSEETQSEIEKKDSVFAEEIKNIDDQLSKLLDWKVNSENYFEKSKSLLSTAQLENMLNFIENIIIIFEVNNSYLLNLKIKKQYLSEKSNFLDSIRKVAQLAISKNKGEITNPPTISLRNYYIEKEKISLDLLKFINLPKEINLTEKLGRLSDTEFAQISCLYKKNNIKESKGFKALNNSKISNKETSYNINNCIENINSKLYTNEFEELFYSNLNTIFESILKNNSKIKKGEFYVYKTHFTINGNVISGSLSSGQQKLITISKYLEEERDAYFLDEPEVFLDSKMTNNIIMSKIIELDSKGIPVFIATHNPNLTINTSPKNIIIRTYNFDNNKYSTYFGNRHGTYFRNLENPDLKIPISPELLDMMEGGKSEFDSRIKYYDK